MLNEIIKGVSMKLNTGFGSGYKIYQDGLKQGLQPPCFFIAVLQLEFTPLLGKRFMSRNPLDVQYFPTESGKNSEIFTVADELMELLEFITLPNDDVLHGTKMNFKVVDGILHFFVNYDFTMTRPTQQDDMETLNLDVGTQEG